MQHAFFSLVRSGLWGTPADRQLFRSVSPDDWETVYRMANSQALLALTFDGISSLPAELRPPRVLYLKMGCPDCTDRTSQQTPQPASARTQYPLPGSRAASRTAERARHRHQLPHSLAPAMRRHRHLFRKTRATHSQSPPAATRRHSRGRSVRQACQLQFERSTHREPPHHPPAEQSACQPALSADYQKMVPAGNRLCPILRNRERGLEGRQYRHTSGHLQCTLYLPACLCTFPEQRNRPAPAMRLDLSACQSPQRNRCHHPASPVAGPRTIACRTSIRLHCRHPTGIARQPASFPLGRHQADRRTIIGRHPVYR